MSSTVQHRYAPALRWLHWTVFVLVLVAYIAINLRETFPHGSSARSDALAAHALAGIAVLLLALPRLAIRINSMTPPIVPPLDRWSRILSRITHIALYLFLIVQPILGIVTLQIAGKSIRLLGITVLPVLFGPGSTELAHQWEDIHGTIGNAFYFVIGLHLLAVLWHHFGRKDNALRRML